MMITVYKILIQLIFLSCTIFSSTRTESVFCPSTCHCSQDPWTLSCARTNLTYIDLENFRATFAFIEEDVFISDWDVGFSSSGLPAATTLNLAGLPQLYLEQLVQVDLSHNILTSFNIPECKSMLYLDISNNRLTELDGPITSCGLQVLNISNNGLTVLEPTLFSQMTELIELNLSGNRLTTIASLAYNVPNIEILRVSNNDLLYLPDDLFYQKTNLSLLDLSFNLIEVFERDTFLGLNLSRLDLGFNRIETVPGEALRGALFINQLILDGLATDELIPRSLESVPVQHISISRCANLNYIRHEAIYSIQTLETVQITENPVLIYIHPGAVSFVPNLLQLNLSHNGLSVLEDLQPFVPSMRILYLTGNNFRCHCGLKWLQKKIIKDDLGFVVKDKDDISCGEDWILLSEIDLSETCEPYVLPLFPESWQLHPGSNLSLLCREVQSELDSSASWLLPPNNTEIATGSQGTKSIQHGVLNISHICPQDSGIYTCKITNTLGDHTRSIQLDIQVPSIQLHHTEITDSTLKLIWFASLRSAYPATYHFSISPTHPVPSLFGSGDGSGEGDEGLKLNGGDGDGVINNTPHVVINVDRTSNDLIIRNLAPNQTYSIQLFQDIPFCQRLVVIGRINITTKPRHAEVADFKNYIIAASTIMTVGILIGAFFTLRHVMVSSVVQNGGKINKMAASAGGMDRSCSHQRLLEKEEDNGLENEEHNVYTISGQNTLVT